jgi:sugar O-acyltransferase (sialic acid O-acetyltransferase NeuD family)
MKRKKLYIIGASGFGREAEVWLEQKPLAERDWEIAGFLHSYQGKSPLEGYPSDYNILGEWETFPLTKDDYCVIAVSDCNWREKIFRELYEKTNFLTYFHPTTIIGKHIELGQGVFICPFCTLSTNIKIGNGVLINTGCQIGHDSVLDDFSSLMANVDVGGWCKIGKKVFMGTKSTLIPRKTIADSATIGIGSVVIRNVKENETIFGNPAKKI